jgi:hypothetical protein
VSADYQASDFGRDVETLQAVFENLKAVASQVKPLAAGLIPHGADEAIHNNW